jgi:hypothetical protein
LLAHLERAGGECGGGAADGDEARDQNQDAALVADATLCSLEWLLVEERLGEGAAIFAPAATGVAGVLWLVGIAALVLLFHGRSSSYFGRSPARG